MNLITVPVPFTEDLRRELVGHIIQEDEPLPHLVTISKEYLTKLFDIPTSYD